MIDLVRIDYQAANRFFDDYEHLGNCGLGVWHWGALAGDRLVAAVSFGTTCFSRNRGLLPAVAEKHGLRVYQICRGGTASTAPFNTASQVLSSALNQLRRLRGDCMVVAYADRAYNEVGTIYQACNGIYTGQTDPKNQANYIIHGKWTSGWGRPQEVWNQILGGSETRGPSRRQSSIKQKVSIRFRSSFRSNSKESHGGVATFGSAVSQSRD